MRVLAMTLVLVLVALAAGGCRKKLNPRSFPNAAAVTMKAGAFLTAPGIYESLDHPGLPDQFIDSRLSITPRGSDLELAFYYETRSSLRSDETNGGGTQPWTTGKVAKGWFFFVEKPGVYWFFDGRDHVYLHGHGPHGSPSKSIIDGSFVNRDNPKVPDAVLARLPQELSRRLTPSSGEHPSF